MPVLSNYSSKAQFIQTCMDQGWVAPGDITALSAAYDFVADPRGLDPTAADSFLEKAAGTEMWTPEGRAVMLNEMKSIFEPLSRESALSGLNLSGRIVAHPENANLSQERLDELMGLQLQASAERQGENDYRQAEEALNREQNHFAPQNSGQ